MKKTKISAVWLLCLLIWDQERRGVAEMTLFFSKKESIMDRKSRGCWSCCWRDMIEHAKYILVGHEYLWVGASVVCNNWAAEYKMNNKIV